MKWRWITMVSLGCAVGFASCSKKKQNADLGKEAVKEVVLETAVDSEPEAVAAPLVLGAAERAMKVGFSQYLPQDTEIVMSFYQGDQLFEAIKKSGFMKLSSLDDPASTELAESGQTDQDAEILADQDAAKNDDGLSNLFAQEFTMAFGHSTGDQAANLLKLGQRMNFYTMVRLVKKLDQKEMDQADLGSIGLLGGDVRENLVDLIQDSESGLDLFEQMQMPPLYLAFRCSEKGRDLALLKLTSSIQILGMLGRSVEPLEVEKNGASFSGFKVIGNEIAKRMMKNRRDMESLLGAANFERFMTMLQKKNLVVLTGVVGEYAMLFIGESEDDLVFAPSVKESLAGGQALAFSDAYADKNWVAMGYCENRSHGQMVAESKSGLSDYAAGLREGLSTVESLGDTRDLEALLRMVQDREALLYALGTSAGGGSVAFLEDGLKMESLGGYDAGIVDWNAKNRLASLGDSEDVLLFANMTSDAIYDEKARAYFEVLLETVYALVMKYCELPGDHVELKNFRHNAKIFDEKFRSELIGIWEVMHTDMKGGLGGERAWVVDLQGAVPALPNIPKSFVDHQVFPRFTVLAPLLDREKLSSSWPKIHGRLTSVIASIGELTEQKIPPPHPMSSDKADMRTWFFALPYFTDDFLPSVILSDPWFAVTTSKNQAQDLLERAKIKGETSQGMTLRLRFEPLAKLAEEAASVLEKESNVSILDQNELKQMKQSGKALHELDVLKISTRREAGVLRTSLHLKTK